VPVLENLENVSGEGGEYETLVLDCPYFSSRLLLENTRVEDTGSGSALLNIGEIRLEDKASFESLMRDLPSP